MAISREAIPRRRVAERVDLGGDIALSSFGVDGWLGEAVHLPPVAA